MTAYDPDLSKRLNDEFENARPSLRIPYAECELPDQSDLEAHFYQDDEGFFFTGASLESVPIPARTWLVRDLIPSGTVTLLSGDGGTGKSLIAQQLAYAVATNGCWLGHDVAAGPSVFISAEDDKDELHRRLDLILLSDFQRGYGDLVDLHMNSLAGKDALLSTIDHAATLRPTELFRRIEQTVDTVKPKLIVFDTLADLFPGNENDRAQARQFIGMLRGLAIRQHCAVLLLSHPSLSGLNSGSGTSGSTAWNNSVRSRLYLERVILDGYEANPDARILRTMKANYGRTGGEIAMTWRAGVFEVDGPASTADRVAGSVKAERVFMSLLRALTEQGRRVNHVGSSTFAPKMFADHPMSEGVSKRAFKTAMEALLASGKIKVEQDGPPSRRVSYLAEA